MPTQIAEFIHQQHIVSLACQQNGELWCANCFYVFDEPNYRLIILTKKSTKHGQMMQQTPQIAGTIASNTQNIRDIEGIQFKAIAHCLEMPDTQKQAQQQYFAHYPLAKLIPSDVWEIKFEEIKHTQNKTIFSQKSYWRAHG